MSRDGNPYFASTFAERKAIREGTAKPQAKVDAKQVDADELEVEDKAVKKATTKRAAKKA